MVMAVKIQHAHKFAVNGNQGICKCGEIREFIWSGGNSTYKVICTGDPDYKDPVTNTELKEDPIPPKPTISNNNTELKEDPIPPKPTNNWEIKEYYDKNRARILADREKFGQTEAEKKWKMGVNTFKNLEKRWKPIPIPSLPGKRSLIEKPIKEFPQKTIYLPLTIQLVDSLIKFYEDQSNKYHLSEDRCIMLQTLNSLKELRRLLNVPQPE